MRLKQHKVGVESAKILSILHEDAFRGGEVWSESSFIELFSMIGVSAWIVTILEEDDALPIGFIMVRECCGEVEIITLGVISSKRRCGIGRYLVKIILDDVKEKNYSLLLEVNIHNKAAIMLYLKLGFKEVGCRKAYYQDGSDALLFKFG